MATNNTNNQYAVFTTKQHDDLCQLINARLEQILNINTCDFPSALPQANTLIAAMRYSVLNGGKRIRPLFTLAAGQLSNADFSTLLTVGCAVELIHCYSLIHDDLPAMDNDDLRRGIPTCHKQYNEAIAILAGDALQTTAFAILSHPSLAIADSTKLKIINLLTQSSGHLGMVGGQALDILYTGNLSAPALQDLHHMDSLKTGALIKAAILSGYLAGNNYEETIYQVLTEFSETTGLLFQLVDDILDVTLDTHSLGKTANKDANAHKATYISVLGLEKAQELTQTLYNRACKSLELCTEFDRCSPLIDILTNIYNTIH